MMHSEPYKLDQTGCHQHLASCKFKFVTGPAKIGHVGSQNLTTFQTFVTYNFLFQYGMATQFSEIVHNLTGFPTHLTEPMQILHFSIEIYLIKSHGIF